MRSAKELAKFTGLPAKSVEDICVFLLDRGLFKQVEHLMPPKYMINENFNSGKATTGGRDKSLVPVQADQKKHKYIDLVYPTKEIADKEDVKMIEELGLSALAGD